MSSGKYVFCCILFLVMKFRERLREELNFQDMTVKELAAKTGIKKRTLDMYLGSRESMPPVDVAIKIAQVLNVSAEYLVMGEDSSISVECKKYLRFKNFIRELDKLSPESWNKLQPLFLAMITQEKVSGLEKNKIKVQGC